MRTTKVNLPVAIKIELIDDINNFRLSRRSTYLKGIISVKNMRILMRLIRYPFQTEPSAAPKVWYGHLYPYQTYQKQTDTPQSGPLWGPLPAVACFDSMTQDVDQPASGSGKWNCKY